MRCAAHSLALLASLLLVGCVALPTENHWGAEVPTERTFSYTRSPEQLRNDLLELLRARYIVDETPDSLRVEIRPYEADAKGPFGWGWKWREKILVSFEFLNDWRRDGETAIRVRAETYERQNAKHDWRLKQGAPFNGEELHDLYQKTQALEDVNDDGKG